jgi:hypothetical protein
MTAQ